jgi:CPA2 family monovalent cation:H+ antiporter-2
MTQLHILQDLVVILAAALVVVLLLGRLRLPTIAGFIVAGALLGPSGFGWVKDAGEIEQLAEIGVVLLLFTIGLEFSISELRRLRRVLIVGGGLQVGLTTLVVTALATLGGLTVARGIFFGFVVALSSTAIVLKGLAERGETDAPHGRLVVGVLLFQDLCVVPMILVAPLVAGDSGVLGPLVRVVLTGAAVIAVTLFLARQVVPRVLHLVAATGSRDVFILAVVLMCAGIAWLTSFVGLSLALGAFLAGTILADSDYGHQAFADVLPLREIFTSLFFVSMGLLLDLRVVADSPGPVLTLAGAVLAGKAVLAALAGLAARFPLQVALLGGLALSQVGEFSFVLARVGRPLGLLDPSEMRLLLAASVITMLVTPFALRLGPHVAAGAVRLGALERLLGRSREELGRILPGLSDHVVVLGFGVGGEMMAEVLRSAGVPFVVLDLNAERVREARRRGEPVSYGDVTSPELLQRARVADARQVVILLNDPSATLRAVRAARRLAPDTPIAARARYVADVPALLQAGATEAVAQEFEASLEVIRRVMKRMSAAAGPAEGAPASAPRSPGATPLVERLPEGLEVQSVPVRDRDWIAGRTLAEAQLRARAGATLVAVSRGDDTAVHPSPSDAFEVGDVVCLVGDTGQIAAARELLARGPRA